MTVVESHPDRHDQADWDTRARRAALDVEAKRQVLEASIQKRDQILIEGVDAGYSHGHIARTMHISRARIHHILATKG